MRFSSNQFFNTLRSYSSYLPRATVAGFALVGLYGYDVRRNDYTISQDAFTKHIEKFRKKHLFSGMLPPLMPTTEQQALNAVHFPELMSIIPTSLEAYREQNALETPVHIKPLRELSANVKASLAGQDPQTLVVGGVPAMMSAYSLAKYGPGKSVIYLNDSRRRAIADNSARHLEQDAETEGPTSYRPTTFLKGQTGRALFGYVSYANAEKTGLYPWRTLDWVGFLTMPQEWAVAIRLAFFFQLQAMQSPEKRAIQTKALAEQCKKNEAFYERLHADLGGNFLQHAPGSIYMARDASELSGLEAMRKSEESEGRHFIQRAPEEMRNRFGFIPNAKKFYEKMHDRSFPATYASQLTSYYKKQGATVVDGTLVNVYADKNKEGGVAEYRTAKGEQVFVVYSRLIASLGSQMIHEMNNKPLFDMVAARGVSVLAHVYVEKGKTLPSIFVAGETNHVNKLNAVSAPVMRNGKAYDLNVYVLTSSACITPNVASKNNTNFDGSAAVGLVSAVRQTLDRDVIVEPFFATGCNRMVSQFGQTTWIEPYPGMHVQFGAGGGGLTRGPDFAVKLEEEMQRKQYTCM